jgi:hypothetical protein
VRDTFFRPILLVTVGLVALLTACGDDPIRPDELFEFVEADAVTRSAAALPSLGEIALATPTTQPSHRAALVLAQQFWTAGAAADPVTGRATRRRAVAYATPVLAELVADDEWPIIRERAEDWMRIAETMLRHLILPDVERRIASARHHLERAESATSAEAQVYNLLLALSDLVETTPRFVARGLVGDAAAAVQRAEARGNTSPAQMERARRLADWAARAAAEEDDVRAIQRAYYAIQLVEGLR